MVRRLVLGDITLYLLPRHLFSNDKNMELFTENRQTWKYRFAFRHILVPKAFFSVNLRSWDSVLVVGRIVLLEEASRKKKSKAR